MPGPADSSVVAPGRVAGRGAGTRPSCRAPARHGDCCSGRPRRATSASGSATPTRSSTAPCRYAGRPVASAVEVGRRHRQGDPCVREPRGPGRRRSSRTRRCTPSCSGRPPAMPVRRCRPPSRRTTDRRPTWSTRRRPGTGPTRRPGGPTPPTCSTAGGVLAVFGSQLRLVDPVLEEAVGVALADQVDDSAFRPAGGAVRAGLGPRRTSRGRGCSRTSERRAGPARDRAPSRSTSATCRRSRRSCGSAAEDRQDVLRRGPRARAGRR